MTWPEIAAALAQGKTTAIIPAGSSEQHGPHLPEGTDSMIAEGLAVRLAARLGSALVAPVIRPGCSDHHLGFPGTISISGELLSDLIGAYITSLRRHGFQRFFVFSSHGGNFPVLQRMMERGLPPEIVVVSNLSEFAEVMVGVLRRYRRDLKVIPHADASETAEMLALHPDRVRADKIERGFTGTIDTERLLVDGLKGVSPSGVLGDPVGATTEMGSEVISALEDYLFGKASVLMPE